MLDDETIYHETTHAVYDKLTEDGFMDDFYEDWAKLNPPDFGYAYTYEDEGAPDSTSRTMQPLLTIIIGMLIYLAMAYIVFGVFALTDRAERRKRGEAA